MIEIDGAAGEGGGQILRTALALSVCTGQAFTLKNIRAGRPKPGLMRQHLACVRAAAQISGAQVQGDELRSRELQFAPGPVRAGEYQFPIGTAGSCLLVLQTVWPALMLADGPSTLHLSGGTHNPMAPPFHFLARAFAPLMERLGATATLTLRRAGFYPAGGGEVLVQVQPAAHTLQPFDLIDRGALRSAEPECLAPGLPRHVPQRELELLCELMGWTFDPRQIAIVRQNEGPGNALLATLQYEAVTEVFMQLGDKGVSAETVTQRLVKELRDYQQLPGAVGPHLADQWMLPLALAVWRRGVPAAYTATELTLHARTNLETIQTFLPVSVSTEHTDAGWRVGIRPSVAA
ncbi:RNA 3'-terminal phosphate cyclase [Roseateles terrae]|uniref:RNA 3'-terminal phosphate cyclase n=1 Tax=Roseateles terrae TaxID=431060 RepID=A0ABR6GXR9_9BURK|nr:RNA 3'-terminal phosphate cyclase [Roseateles terrae]MBB3196839.1 RNA 3'-terminal phosphate cyclase (ATP) [Roseateles terrae]OWQ84601.1 RNA 3'-phosphate cyclase [Roseateles terrae]